MTARVAVEAGSRVESLGWGVCVFGVAGPFEPRVRAVYVPFPHINTLAHHGVNAVRVT